MTDGIHRITPKLSFNAHRLTRFSSGLAGRLAATSFIPSALLFMEQNNNAEVIIKDVLGFNTPKIAVASMRSKGDMYDTARLELSNTAFTFFSLLTMPHLFRKIAARSANLAPEKLLKNLQLEAPLKSISSARYHAQKQLAHVAGSLGFMIPFSFAYVAIPYLRNYLTLKQNGTANFEAIIGLEKDAPKSSNKDLKSQLDVQMGKVKSIMAWGVSLGIASALGLGTLSKRLPQTLSKQTLKQINTAYNWLKMGGKNADQLGNDFTVLAFWLLPAYVGYLVSARSKNEFKEQLLKSVNGVLWFTVFNRFLTKPAFGQVFKELQNKLGVTLAKGPGQLAPNASLWQQLKYKANMNKYIPTIEAIKAIEQSHPEAFKAFMKQKVIAELSQLAISISMLAATPAILNIVLTRRRYAAEQRHKQNIHQTHFAASESTP